MDQPKKPRMEEAAGMENENLMRCVQKFSNVGMEITTANFYGLVTTPNMNVQNSMTGQPPVGSKSVPKFLPMIERPSHHFTGRLQILRDIDSNFNHPTTERGTRMGDDGMKNILVLTGPGGMGKSEIAKKYAEQFGQNYSHNIAWIDADSLQSLTTSFLTIAKGQGLSNFDLDPNGQVVQPPTAQLYGHLANTVMGSAGDEEEKKFLFIFDNAEQLNSNQSQDAGFGIYAYLPIHQYVDRHGNAINPFHVLVTSRNKGWGGMIQTLPIDEGLSESETLEFFEKYFKNSTTKNHDTRNQQERLNGFKKLWEILRGYPLALVLASAFIQDHYSDDLEEAIGEYVSLFEDRGQEWLSLDPDTRATTYPHIMETVFDRTIQKISRQNHPSNPLLLLHQISFLDPDDITLKLCASLHINELVDDLTSLDKFMVDKIKGLRHGLALLEKFSLIKILGPQGLSKNPIIRIHRIIQKCGRELLDQFFSKNPMTTTILKLLRKCNETRVLYFDSHVKTIQRFLRQQGWPDDSIFDGNYLALRSGVRQHCTKLLKEIYKNLTSLVAANNGNKNLDRELLAVKLALVYFIKLHPFIHGTQTKKKSGDFLLENKFLLDPPLDPKDPLYRLDAAQFFNLTASQLSSSASSPSGCDLGVKNFSENLDYICVYIVLRLTQGIRYSMSDICQKSLESIAGCSRLYKTYCWYEFFQEFLAEHGPNLSDEIVGKLMGNYIQNCRSQLERNDLESLEFRWDDLFGLILTNAQILIAFGQQGGLGLIEDGLERFTSAEYISHPVLLFIFDILITNIGRRSDMLSNILATSDLSRSILSVYLRLVTATQAPNLDFVAWSQLVTKYCKLVEELAQFENFRQLLFSLDPHFLGGVKGCLEFLARHPAQFLEDPRVVIAILRTWFARFPKEMDAGRGGQLTDVSLISDELEMFQNIIIKNDKNHKDQLKWKENKDFETFLNFLTIISTPSKDAQVEEELCTKFLTHLRTYNGQELVTPGGGCSDRVSWSHGVDGHIPEGSVVGGRRDDEIDLFIVKESLDDSDFYLAQPLPSHGVSLVDEDGSTRILSSYQILVTHDQQHGVPIVETEWIPSQKGQVVPNAVSVGTTFNPDRNWPAQSVYVGRTVHKGNLAVGSVVASETALHCQGAVYTQYDLLVFRK